VRTIDLRTHEAVILVNQMLLISFGLMLVVIQLTKHSLILSVEDAS
jgi:hypothetical protein